MNRIYRDVAGPCLAPRGSVVCIGAFDGVHRGHRGVLVHVRERAAALGLAPVAISFEPIPREFFSRSESVPRLSASRDKLEALFAAGIEKVLLLRFDARLAAMTAPEFVERVLVARLATREIWIGAGFRFGHARTGDEALLRQMGASRDFAVGTAPQIDADGERVSSSRIRALLGAGQLVDAERLLGRPFAIGGHVIHGPQLGRKLGYPTANLPLQRRVAPVQGIFAVRVRGVIAEPLPGVASLGVRPTVNGIRPLLEAHLFDFDGDLYGRRIEVEFVAKLRDEAKFPDLPALVRQMDIDAAQARRILGVVARAKVGAMQ